MQKYDINNKILICSSKNNRLWYKNGELFISDAEREFNKRICKLKQYGLGAGPLSKCRPIQRLLRLVPRCGIFVDENTALVSCHGKILKVLVKEMSTEVEHCYRSGMNNPLFFSRIKGVHGFEDGIYYGEYFGNLHKEPVRIFRRKDDGQWVGVYSFQKGEIKHIHGIVGDPEHGYVYVLTGDEHNESGIWRFEDNFKKLKIIKRGGQQYRACVGFPFRNGFFYATDTPIESNYIYYMEDVDMEPIRLKGIEGPCIYGTRINANLFAVSTSVEPDSRDKGWKYRFSYRRGNGVKSWNSKVYIGNPDIGFKEVFSIRKDILPMTLFGFGTFLFPDSMLEELCITPQSVRRIDGKTLFINIRR